MPDSNRRISAPTMTLYGYSLLLSGRSRLLWLTWPLALRSLRWRSSINLRSSRIPSHICGPIEIHLEKGMWRLDKNTLIQPTDTPALSQEFQVPQFGQRLYDVQETCFECTSWWRKKTKFMDETADISLLELRSTVAIVPDD